MHDKLLVLLATGGAALHWGGMESGIGPAGSGNNIRTPYEMCVHCPGEKAAETRWQSLAAPTA